MDNEQMKNLASILNDEASGVGMDLITELNGAAALSPIFRRFGECFANTIEAMLKQEDILTSEALLRNIMVAYFCARNRENAIMYEAGRRMQMVNLLDEIYETEKR